MKLPSIRFLTLAMTLAAATATHAVAASDPKAAATKKPASAKTAVASVCKGMVEAGCKTNTACSWVVPKKIDKSGKQEAAYCRKKTGFTTKTSVPGSTAVPAAKG